MKRECSLDRDENTTQKLKSVRFIGAEPFLLLPNSTFLREPVFELRLEHQLIRTGHRVFVQGLIYTVIASCVRPFCTELQPFRPRLQ